MLSFLVLVSLPLTGLDRQPGPTLAVEGAGPRVQARSDAVRAKLHPLLRQAYAERPGDAVMVHVYTEAGADLSGYLDNAVSRKALIAGRYTAHSGVVTARDLVKLASLNHVVAVEPLEGAYRPTSEPGSYRTESAQLSPEQESRLRELARGSTSNVSPSVFQPPINPDGWHDVLNTHNSALAWDKGYTGAGVTVMVNDSGIDFAHPDLIGTWATVEDPSSPYYGWPLQFDQYSMLLLAFDQQAGTDFVASGTGHYADTSTVVSEADTAYQPLDAATPNTYTLTGTSRSGDYHIGTHPDTSLRVWYFILTGTEPASQEDLGQRPAVLVVDEAEAGVYDTVYVDLDFDLDFSDEKAVNRESPVSGADWWGAFDPATGQVAPEPDGLYDISGGLVYFIADGALPVPASDWLYGLEPPSNGALVAFTVNDFVASPAGNHGMLAASAVAAQGVIDGDSYGAILLDDDASGVRPPYKPEDTSGMVTAAGRDVKLVSAGDFYSTGGVDAFLFAALGYDGIPGSGDDVEIMSNSWGSVAANDGWDAFSRLIDLVTRTVNPSLLVLFSAGNEGPGFGTVSVPQAPSSVVVGAMTQYGSTGWDSAASADQITFGDVSAFSSRGPNGIGGPGVHLVASGAWSSGAVPLNEALIGGWHAWSTWGGTSRATPVAAGNAALVYQAYYETWGAWPDAETGRALLMSGARDLHYGPFLQGAGAVDANRSVDLASGRSGAWVWPNTWEPGSGEHAEAPGFAQWLNPGESAEAWFYVTNPTGETIYLQLEDQWLQKTGTWEEEWTSAPVAEEPIQLTEGDPSATVFDWDAPHYLWDVTGQIPADTDLVVWRHNYEMQYFDPQQSHQWRQVNDFYAMAFDWKDVNGNGRLWEDRDGDGVVDLDEIDQGEYMRFDYANQRATSGYLTVQRPLDRVADGFFVGLTHNQARADVPETPMMIGLDFYQQVDMPWLSVGQSSLSIPPGETARIKAQVAVPGDAPAGLYEARITFGDGYWTTVVPVTINVAPDGHSWRASGTAGESYYNNGLVFGAQAWNGIESTGDHRFFYGELPETAGVLENKMPDGSYHWLADVTWQTTPTDVDLWLMSPYLDDFSAEEPGYYGPYTLEVAGSSPILLAGDGAFVPNTSSGTSREVVSVPYLPGLNGIVLQNTNFSGDYPAEMIELRTGVIGVSESPIALSRPANAASATIPESVVSTIPLAGLTVEAFGLSKPEVHAGLTVRQDDPSDPLTASYTQEINVQHGGLLEISIDGQDGDDLDLYLYRDAGDGNFQQIAASVTAGADEFIRLTLPDDGIYRVAVHGWLVPAGESAFALTINNVQGNDLQVNNLPEGQISPNRQYGFDVSFDATGWEPGSYTGVVTLGPPEGPGAVVVFVQVEITE
jgi:hypothetical protein